ncbi:hypothetical protein CVS40_8596 [Lucilia cuprina]|nr:hypothetical protein CVS40_8596 [Lucilia cuprina]
MRGQGILNNLIDILPIELHIPGYQFCGPGTKLKKRLARGDKGINPLDTACREHDIAYFQNRDSTERSKADKKLTERAWERVLSKDSSIGEKTSAYIVTNAMKTKTKFGMGLQNKKQLCNKKLFLKTIKTATNILKKEKPQDIQHAIKLAQKIINNSFKGNEHNIIIPRVIKLPKTGGFLPIIPIITALGALGSITSGATSIAKAITFAKNAKKKLDESVRHNKTMETIAMGKGLFLKPYKKDITKFANKNIPNFRGVFMRDMLPKRSKRIECGIVNLDSAIGSGTHWVAYYKNNKYIKYFDSFGNLQPPLEIMKYLGKDIEYNHEQKQQYNTFNCGHLCLKFLYNQIKNK